MDKMPPDSGSRLAALVLAVSGSADPLNSYFNGPLPLGRCRVEFGSERLQILEMAGAASTNRVAVDGHLMAELGMVATSFSLFHAQKLLGQSTQKVTSDYYAGLTGLLELDPIGKPRAAANESLPVKAPL